MAKKTKEPSKGFMEDIKKKYGEGIVMKLSDAPQMTVSTVSTGSLSLDIALGVGGHPRGRIVEIFGPESSGKTTLTLHAIAEAQKAGLKAAFIDAEHALDPKYAAALGVNVDELYVSQPENGEQALDLAEMMVDSGEFGIIVIDSVAALVPKAELEGEVGDHHVGVQARMMSQALRKLASKVSDSQCVLVFINQIRMKIGVMFGSPETTTGGNGLKFYASVRLDIRRVGAIKEGDEAIGNRSRVKVVKNKVAPPFKECEFDIIFGEGINYVGEILDYAELLKLVDKSGAWYSCDGERIGQGRSNSIEYLKNNPELLARLDANIRKHYRLPERV
jgi:recombination protein RecA